MPVSSAQSGCRPCASCFAPSTVLPGVVHKHLLDAGQVIGPYACRGSPAGGAGQGQTRWALLGRARSHGRGRARGDRSRSGPGSLDAEDGKEGGHGDEVAAANPDDGDGEGAGAGQLVRLRAPNAENSAGGLDVRGGAEASDGLDRPPGRRGCPDRGRLGAPIYIGAAAACRGRTCAAGLCPPGCLTVVAHWVAQTLPTKRYPSMASPSAAAWSFQMLQGLPGALPLRLPSQGPTSMSGRDEYGDLGSPLRPGG
jgi:hypothetical protein